MVNSHCGILSGYKLFVHQEINILNIIKPTFGAESQPLLRPNQASSAATSLPLLLLIFPQQNGVNPFVTG